jgi:microcystin-dependent protein
MQPFLTVNYCIAGIGIFPSPNSDPFLGEITVFGFNFAPRGWFKCDGQLLSINSNQALFALLGTTYGGDGRTTFGLPDLRGRVPIHQGNGPGLSPRNMGQRSGTETETPVILPL